MNEHEPALRVGTGASAAGRPARRSLFFLLLTLALALAVSMLVFAGEAEAKKKLKPFTKSSTATQSGATNVKAHNAAIATYTFSNTNKIVSLRRVTTTLTIGDGDTGASDLDFNDLTLKLDGTDTEIKLNGFDNAQTDTLTITGVLPAQKAAKILADLKADGQLVAQIDEKNPNNNVDAGNQNTVTLPAVATTLTIKGKRK